VLEEVLAFTELLPARFGLISSSDDRIAQVLLKERHDELVSILAHVRGRVELGLKVFWKREQLFTDIADGREDIRSLREAASARPAGAGRFDVIRLGQMVEGAMDQLRGSEADEILDELEPLCLETRSNNLLTDMMVLNAAFLVEKEREAEFDAAVGAIAARNAERLTFKYVGTLPPYNFVDLAWDGG
jgi:hypothetical protein